MKQMLFIPILLATVAVVASADENLPPPGVAEPRTIENPEYLRWAKFKPGSWVEFRLIDETGATKAESVVQHTLSSIDKEKATIATLTKVEIDGKASTIEGPRRDIPARIPAPKPAEEVALEEAAFD